MLHGPTGTGAAPMPLRRFAQSLVNDHGVRGTMRKLKVSLVTLNKIIDGAPVRRGTILLFRQAMIDAGQADAR